MGMWPLIIFLGETRSWENGRNGQIHLARGLIWGWAHCNLLLIELFLLLIDLVNEILLLQRFYDVVLRRLLLRPFLFGLLLYQLRRRFQIQLALVLSMKLLDVRVTLFVTVISIFRVFPGRRIDSFRSKCFFAQRLCNSLNFLRFGPHILLTTPIFNIIRL